MMGESEMIEKEEIEKRYIVADPTREKRSLENHQKKIDLTSHSISMEARN